MTLPEHFARPGAAADTFASALSDRWYWPAINWFVTHEWESIDPTDGLEQMTTPTLVLTGEHDITFGPVVAERLASSCGNASVAVITGRATSRGSKNLPPSRGRCARFFKGPAPTLDGGPQRLSHLVGDSSSSPTADPCRHASPGSEHDGTTVFHTHSTATEPSRHGTRGSRTASCGVVRDGWGGAHRVLVIAE